MRLEVRTDSLEIWSESLGDNKSLGAFEQAEWDKSGYRVLRISPALALSEAGRYSCQDAEDEKAESPPPLSEEEGLFAIECRRVYHELAILKGATSSDNTSLAVLRRILEQAFKKRGIEIGAPKWPVNPEVTPPPKETEPPVFKVGQKVRHRASGEVGIVEKVDVIEPPGYCVAVGFRDRYWVLAEELEAVEEPEVRWSELADTLLKSRSPEDSKEAHFVERCQEAYRHLMKLNPLLEYGTLEESRRFSDAVRALREAFLGIGVDPDSVLKAEDMEAPPGPEPWEGYLCVQHGGSPTCVMRNEQRGWHCPKCGPR